MISILIKKIERITLSIFFIYGSFQVTAQKHEIGVGLGASNYTGEIVQLIDVRNFRPAGQIYYRFNLSQVVSLKVATSLGILAASDNKYSNATAKYRNASFSTLYNDVSAMIEYNFLDFAYKDKSNSSHFSPYLSAGIGILNYKSTISDPNYKVNTLFQPIIPFGGGLKYRTNAHLTFNFQFTINKTFTDAIDGIYNQNGASKLVSNPHTTDWYYSTGITVGYIFWKVYCT